MSNQGKTPGALPSVLAAIGLLLLFVAERVLAEGTGRTVLVGLASGAIIAGLALRIQSYLASTGDVRRVEARVLGAYVGVAFSLVVYALSTERGLKILGVGRDSAEKVSTILDVLWLVTLVVSLTTLLFMDVAYRRMPLAQAVEFRRVRIASQAGLGLALAVVFLFSINYVAHKRDIKRDLSYFKTTRPSETSLRLVQKLGDPLRVVLFYPQVNEVLEQVRPFFEQLSGSSKNFKLEVVDHALSPKFAREQRIQGNGYVLMIRGKEMGPNAQTERFEIGTELEAARPNLKTLDAKFQEHFTKLTRPPRSLQLTVGHGERNSNQREGLGTGDGVTVLREILNRFNIKSNDLGVSQGLASKIPENAGAVAILGPREPFLKEEAEALLRFVQGGGRLLVSIDPDVDSGLEPLLQGLGLKTQKGVIASEQQHMRRTFTPADNTIVFSNDYSSHPTVTTASRHSREVATIFLQGVALSEATEGPKPTPAPTVTFPVHSTNEFFRDLNGNFVRDADEPQERLNMIAAVTVGKDKKEGRAVIIGDGDFATDQLLPNRGNLLPFIDSLRWLIGEEDISGNLSSEEDVPIEHTRDEDKVWFYLTTFAVPVPIIGAGIWISRRRRQRAEAKKS